MVETSNGAEALRTLATGNFDLVLMDVQMPEMDGLDATRRLRKRPKDESGAIPVIGVTARAMPEDRALCLESGMTEYLTKPVRADDLAAAIARCCGRPATTVQPSRVSVPGRVSVNLLREFVGDDDQVACEIIASFLEDLPSRLDALREAARRGDAQGVMQSSHTLKGSVSTFGASEARTAAAELEAKSRDGDLENADSLLTVVEAEFELVRVELEQIRAELGRAPSSHGGCDDGESEAAPPTPGVVTP